MSVGRLMPGREFLRQSAAGVRFTARAGGRMFWATSLTLAAGTVGMAVELLLGRAVVDRLVNADRLDGPAYALLAFVVVVAAIIAFSRLAGAGLHRMLAEQVVRRASSDLLETTAACELAEFDRTEFHDRIRRASHASGSSLQIALAAPELVSVAIGGVGLVIAVATVSPLLVPAALLSGIPLLLAGGANARSMYSFSFGATPNDRERFQLEEVLKGRDEAAEVRVFGIQRSLLRRWNNLYDERISGLWKVVRSYLRRSMISAIAVAVTLVLLAATLGWLFSSGRIDLVAAATAAVSVLILAAQVQTASASIGGLQESSAQFADYFDTTAELAAHRERDRAKEDAEPLTELRLNGVTFRYAGAERPALSEVDLTIGAGEMVAIVGHNGSGKTTLAKLLCGLYEPESGTITWNGVPMSRIRPGFQVGALFQTFARYWFSARDNISLDSDDHERLPTREGHRAREAAIAAGADDFLSALPQGYDTRLAVELDGGVDLSIGQWQRVAISRVLYRRPSLIVLDEPTSALDAEAEADLFDTLAGLRRGRTLVVISHRFSTVRVADRIVVVDHGRIVEEGDHHQLMAQNGTYARMFTRQASAYVGEPST